MRIIQISPFFYPVSGGMEEHVLQISKNLIKRGYHVSVFTSDSLRHGRIRERHERIQGIDVYRFTTLLSLGDFGKFWPGFILRLCKDNYDIVHVHNYRHIHTIISLMICLIRKKPCLITTHSPFHPPYLRGSLSRLFVHFYDKILKRILDNLFSKIILITESEKEYFSHVNYKKITVIPNGISKNIFRRIDKKIRDRIIKKFSIEKDDRIILYVGRIHPTKGLQFILKAFYNLYKKDKRYKLIIVGPLQKGEYLESLLEFAKTHGFSNSVVFTGFVSEIEKLVLYDASTVFVLPSIYEPFGIVILEAFARGKPVIAVDSDGPRYLIKNGENGFLVKYGDVESLAKYIERLLINKRLYMKISKNNRKKAKEFTWDKIVDKLEKVYHEVLNQ